MLRSDFPHADAAVAAVCGMPTQRRRRPFEPRTLAMAVAGAFVAGGAWAQVLPTGGVAIHGQAGISTPAANQLVVTTRNGAGTGHSAINWQSFSLSAGSSARFVQPDAGSLSINRVVTNTPSAIFGNLSSNGRLVLVNQSGITVGAGAVVDTAGFTASALRMTDADALAGRLRFGAGNGAATMGGGAGLTVDGTIVARDGDVVLIAPQIGIGTSALVQAPNGSTVLAAGQQVEITGRGLEGISMLVQARSDEARNLGRLEGDAVGVFAGTLRHSGEIQATTATLEGGQVVLKAAGDAYVEGSGSVRAIGTRGGQVDILGERVALTGRALVDVSGTLGGGQIRIGGDYQGRNTDIPNADRTFVGQDTVLRADATGSGDGGRIIVWADTLTKAHGTVSARGGPQGGNGGFAEISGKQQLVFDGGVDLRAPLGLPGTLLLDPDFIDIAIGGLAILGDVNLFGINLGQLLTISPATLNAVGGNVALQAVEDITFTDPVNLTTLGAALTAEAGGVISVGATITTNQGPITLYANAPGAGGTGSNGSAVYVNAALSSGGAAITLRSDASDVGGNAVYVAANVNAGTGPLALLAPNDVIDLVAGNVTAGNLNLTASFDVNQTGGSIAASGTTVLDASNVSLTQAGNNFNVFGGVANTVSVTDASGITLGSSNFSQLTVNANGNVGQNASVIVGGTTTISAGIGNVTLTTAGNNLNNLSVSGNALNIVEGAGSALTVLSLSSGLNQPVSLAAGHNLTLPAATIDTGTADLTLSSGNTLTIQGPLLGNNIDLSAVAGAVVGGPVDASGNLDVTVTGGASTMTVNQTIGSGANMALTLAGNLTVLSGGDGVVALTAAGNQTITAGGNILLQGGASGDSNAVAIATTGVASMQSVSANGITVLGGADGGGVGIGNYASIRAAGSQAVTVGNGGITMTGGGGSLSENYANIEQNGGAGTTQSITVNGTGSIVMTGGSALGVGSHASIHTDNGDSQTITFTGGGAGRAITLTGGTNGSDAYAEIYAGTGTQTITGAGLVTLTGGASGGGASFGGDTLGNLAAISADTNDQTIVANGIVVQGGAAGLNNLGGIYGGGNQSITVGAGGLSLAGGSGGGSDLKNAAIIWKGSDVPGTSQTVTVGDGGSVTLQGGSASASNVGIDADFDGLSNGAFAAIRSEGFAQLIEFTAAGSSISMTGGTVGSANFASIQAVTGSQTIRGGIASNAPAIDMTGGASGGVTNEGNRALIGAELGTQNISASAIDISGGAGGTENLAQIRQGGVAAGLGESQTITVVGGGDVAIQGGNGATNLARIQAYGLAQTIDLGTGGSLSLTGGTGASLNFARIEAVNGDQFITGSADIMLTGGASGGTTGNGNFADIRQRNIAGLQSITAGALTLMGGDAGIENIAALTADGDQVVGADSMTLAGGAGGDTNRAGIVSNSGSQSIDVGAGGLSVTGGSGGVTDRRNFASIFQGGLAGTSQTITVAGGGNVTLQAGDSAGTGVGTDNGSLAYITNQGDTQLLEFTGTGSAISITAGSVGSLNTAGILARNGSQTIRGSIAAHAPSFVVTGGSGGIAGEANGANIGANAGTQTISAKAVTLNGGSGIDSFAIITAPNQSITIDGDLALLGAGGTGSSPGARIGGRGGAAGSNAVLDLTVTGNMTLTAGAAAGATIGTTGLTNGLTNDIAIAAGGNLTLSPSAGAGVRIGSRAIDVQAGTIAVSAGSITTNAGDGASNVAGIRTLGTISLTSAAGVNEAIDTEITADGLSVSAATGILMNSAANLVTHLFANNSSSGNLEYSQAAGSLLTVTGINHVGTGNVVITADDLDITGAMTAAAGSVTLRPLALARNTVIENTPGGGVLSLSPTELQFVSTPLLTVGRLDGTGNLDVNRFLTDSDVNAATLRLVSGGNFNHGPASGIGAGAGTFNLDIVANNDVNLTNSNINLGDNRNLQVYADNDGSGTGSVNIGAVTLRVGTGAGNATGLMDVKGAGITAAVSGGGGALLEVTGAGNQTFTATDLDLAFLNQNTVGGSLQVLAGSGVQTFSAGSGTLNLVAGTGSNTSATIASGGSQSLAANQLQLTGGSAGDQNFVFIRQNGNASQDIAIGAGGINLTGGGGTNNFAAIEQTGATGDQDVTSAGNIDVDAGGGAGGNNAARISAAGDGGQTINLTGGGAISVQGGASGFSNVASITSLSGDQSIAGANAISILGGAAGGGFNVGNRAFIGHGTAASVGTQSISVGSGGLLIQGGGGTGEDTDNSAFLSSVTNGTQSITVTGGGDITVIGGSSAKQGVGGSGHGSRAGIDGGTSTTIQQIVTLDGGDITLIGGTNGSRNYAGINSDFGAQIISGATDITLTGGASGGIANEGNRALINAGTSQSISATNIRLEGGADGTLNQARIYSFGPGPFTQTITASNSISLTGGGGGGGFNTGNSARIISDGNQLVTAGAGGIDIAGGGGSLSDNNASIYQRGTTGTSQTVRATGGGNILIQGGSSAQTNVGGLGHGSFAAIEATGDTQLVDFVGGGSLTITGGTNGSRNLASIYAPNGNQTVSGAAATTLRGGASGGFAGEGNTASILASTGTQSISTGNFELFGGDDGIQNLALVSGFAGQTIGANALTLVGGAGGGGFGNGNRAYMGSNAIQLLNVGAGGLHIAGGGGSLSDNAAQIEQLGLAGSQTINLAAGAALILQGGSSAGTNVGGSGHGSRASIYAEGVSQNLNFAGSGSITMTGGTTGSRNLAQIFAENNASQNITGSPTITMTGGATGGVAGEGNYVVIGARAGAQTIEAGATTLIGGAGGVENSSSITAALQTLTINGDMFTTGGAGTGGVRIGGAGSTGNTNLTLDITGDLAITGGSGSGVAIGTSGNGVGLVNNIAISTTGSVTLAPSATQNVRIGSPLADLQGGGIFIDSGGDISLVGSGGSGVARISSLGDVTLGANTLAIDGIVLGGTIFAASASAIGLSGAGNLTANAGSGDAIELVSGGTFNNTAGSGALSVSAGARWLVYSGNPANDTRGGLVHDFKQYDKTFGDANPILGTGNGFLYGITPTASVSLTGTVSKVYDGGTVATLAAGNFLATGGVDGDVVSVGGGATGTYDNRNVGSGKTVDVSGFVVSALGGTAPVFGYALASGTASGVVGTITAAPLTVSTGDVNKTYDATTAAPSAVAIVTTGALVGGDTLGGGSFAFLDPNADTGKTVTVSGVTVNDGNGGLNYTVTTADNTNSSITAANLTLGTINVIKTYDGTTGAAGALVVTGGALFGSDSVSGGSFAFTNKNAGIGNKVVTVGGATVSDGNSGANYNVAYTNNTTSTINRADISSVTGITAADKVYDGNTAATLATGSAVFNGMIGGDVLAVTGASGAFADRNAGTAKPVAISGITLSGTDAGNYNLLGSTGSTTADITQASITIGTSAVNKPYDGTTSAAGSALVTGGALVGGDTLAGGTFSFLDPDVGSGKTVTVSGVTINDGNGGANYAVSFTSNTVSSITALAASTWSGLGGNNLWSNPANWDVLPVTGNVLSVSIPAGGGTVVFDAAAGTTNLQSLSSQQAISVTGGSLVLGTSLNAPTLIQSGGTLKVGTSLTTSSLAQNAGMLEVGSSLTTGTLAQSGGDLVVGGNVTAGSFSQGPGATLSGPGALFVSNSFSQSGGSVTMGGIAINQTSGNLLIGNLAAPTITLSAPAGAIGQTGAMNAATLSTQSATGTNLNQAANQIGTLVASNSGTGDIVLVNASPLILGTIANAGGNIDVFNTGAVTTVGPVTAPAGDVTIVANSPLTVGPGGITAGGNIVLHATNLTSAGNLTLDGALVAGNTVSLTADANMVQNFAVLGANGVTAAAAGSMTYGPLATTNAPPILYTAGGVPVAPPPTVLASSLQAPGDIVVTFRELLEQAIYGTTGDDLETNPDGSKKKKDDENIVTEEELCR